MSTLHMSIDPTFTHRVVEILREHLWSGCPEKIVSFMKQGFGIDNQSIITKILTGEYVMIFEEDGGGNIKHRNEVTVKEMNAMDGLPSVLSICDIIQQIRLRVKSIIESQKFILKNYVELFNIHKQHDVNFNSAVLDTKFGELVDLSNVDMDLVATMTTKDLIRIYVDSDKNPYAKGIIDDIIERESSRTQSAVWMFYLLDVITRTHEEQCKLNKTFQYIKENKMLGDINIEHLDDYNDDGTRATIDEMMQKCGDHYLFTPYIQYCYEIDETYNFIHAGDAEFNAKASLVMSNLNLAQAAVKNLTVENEKYDRNKSQKDELDLYLSKALEEPKPFGPVKPNEQDWDAGWISPDGAFFADKGAVANFLHLGLAEEIVKYYGMKDEEAMKNPDHYLERLGWMKFHHMEVGFVGYTVWGVGLKEHSVTKRQIDKLKDYALHMGYKKLTASFTGKSIDINEMDDYTQEEWAEILS